MQYPETRMVTVHHIFSGCPDFVRDHTVLTEKIASTLADEAFADSVRRQYPLTSKAETWLSAALYQVQKQAGEIMMDHGRAAWVWHRIKQAADAFGVDTAAIVNTVEAAYAARHEKQATVYALELADEHGNIVTRGYPIADAQGVKQAADYFARHERHYPMNVRTGLARKIAEQAGRFRVDLDTLPGGARISAYNLDSYVHRDRVLNALEKRASRADDPDLRKVIQTTRTMLTMMPIRDLQEQREKIASMLDHIDTALGIRGMYGIEYESPESVVFAIGGKEASDLLDRRVPLAGYTFDAAQLAQLNPARAFAPVLGAEKVAEFVENGVVNQARLAGVLSSLPAPTQQQLVRHLKAICV